MLRSSAPENKCGARSATIQSVYTSNVALQTHAERYVPFPNSGASHTFAVAPFRKTQRWKRSVCKRNAYPLQDWGRCNEKDPVQCKRCFIASISITSCTEKMYDIDLSKNDVKCGKFILHEI